MHYHETNREGGGSKFFRSGMYHTNSHVRRTFFSFISSILPLLLALLRHNTYIILLVVLSLLSTSPGYSSLEGPTAYSHESNTIRWAKHHTPNFSLHRETSELSMYTHVVDDYTGSVDVKCPILKANFSSQLLRVGYDHSSEEGEGWWWSDGIW